MILLQWLPEVAASRCCWLGEEHVEWQYDWGECEYDLVIVLAFIIGAFCKSSASASTSSSVFLQNSHGASYKLVGAPTSSYEGKKLKRYKGKMLDPSFRKVLTNFFLMRPKRQKESKKTEKTKLIESLNITKLQKADNTMTSLELIFLIIPLIPLCTMTFLGVSSSPLSFPGFPCHRNVSWSL